MPNWFDSFKNATFGAPQGPSSTPPSTDPILDTAAGKGVTKATGLSSWAKMLGLSRGEPTPPPEDRMAKPSELADLEAGIAPPLPGGDRYFSGTVEGNNDRHGLERNKDGTYKAPTIQSWDATGKTYGNRQGDIDARDGAKAKVGAPEIYQPDLSKIPRHTEGQHGLQDLAKINAPLPDGTVPKHNITGAGAFTSTAWGTNVDPFTTGAVTTTNPLTGQGVTSFASGGAQAGGEFKTGYRAVAHSDDMRHTAQAEAGLVASGGASYGLGLNTQSGFHATAGVGGKAGAYAVGDANTKTGAVNVGGIDYDAGVGVHGEAFLGAKAGAGGAIGLGPDFVGAKGSAGAFIGAEAAGDIHGHLGPVGGRVGGSVMAGAGAGIDGDISYKDGKFHMGGKMFAALGYGGSLGGDITIDVGKIGASAANLLDSGMGLAQNAGQSMREGAIQLGGHIANGANAAGTAISNGVDAAGDAISDGASAVGRGVSNAGNAIYNGAADLFSW